MIVGKGADPPPAFGLSGLCFVGPESHTDMAMFHAGIAELVRRDPRYAYEAYEFVFNALHHTQKKLGRVPGEESGDPGPHHHVNGRELLEGVRDLARREFGLMARTVFHLWGIDRTDDFGEIVINLVQVNRMRKS